MSHTPSPWEAIPQHGAGPMIAHPFETGKQMNPTGLRLVCHMLQRGSSLEEDQANAKLIAAAPEMAEALHMLVCLIDPDNFQQAFDKATAVLAKAGL